MTAWRRWIGTCILLLVGTLGRTVEVSLPPLPPITARDTVLVVAPHPDDEALCCGGLIHRAREAGARVAIVWITNGDGFRLDAMLTQRVLFPNASVYQSLARIRMDEARESARSLDVSPDSLFFLGYPDRGISQLMGAFYDARSPWRSSFTHANSVDYPGSFDPGAAYEGARLAADFGAVLDRVKPTLVFAPSVHDSHPDHRGTALLAIRVLRERGELGELRNWIVHGGSGWPTGGFTPQAPQSIAPNGAGLRWMELQLDPASVTAKLQAITAHQSQMRVMAHTMRRYVRSTELFAPLPPGEAQNPPR